MYVCNGVVCSHATSILSDNMSSKSARAEANQFQYEQKLAKEA